MFPFLLGYATLKYRLFDIKVMATELLVFAIWSFLIIRIGLAVSFAERLTDGTLLFIMVVFGIFLIRSVRHEIETRERIESLATEWQLPTMN